MALNIIETIDCSHASGVPNAVFSSTVPIRLTGLVAHWPAVRHGQQGVQPMVDYLMQYSKNQALTVYRGEPAIEGRFFYNEDLTGFNFERLRMPFNEALALLLQTGGESPDSIYVGSTMIDHWLPGFRGDNPMALDHLEPLVSVWFGNQSKIAAHYDFPNNIACNVSGRRRFTLFAPEQADNLYIGPLDLTPSGQAISLVDVTQPDLDTFPNYQYAQDVAITVELGPGDAIYIPSMWWHHVQALESFNALVNYWWRDTPVYLGAPANALQHAMMAMHGLPPEQKDVWKRIFERYVFNQDDQAFSHIPEHARGVLADLDEDMAKAIKSRLVHFLK